MQGWLLCLRPRAPAHNNTLAGENTPRSTGTARRQPTLNITSAPRWPQIYVIYYSTYGHIAALAKAMKGEHLPRAPMAVPRMKCAGVRGSPRRSPRRPRPRARLAEGIDSVDGVEGVLYQVAETLPAEVLEKMHAAPKDEEVPVIDPKTINEVGAARARSCGTRRRTQGAGTMARSRQPRPARGGLHALSSCALTLTAGEIAAPCLGTDAAPNPLPLSPGRWLCFWLPHALRHDGRPDEGGPR